MEGSVWTGTLAGFREKAGGIDPVPAGVAISAVTASLAMALVSKVLAIARRKKSHASDWPRIDALLDAARSESTLLSRLADDDIEAYKQYLARKGPIAALDTPEKSPDTNPQSRLRFAGDYSGEQRNKSTAIVGIPMNATQAAVRGLRICAEAADIVKGPTAADIAAAAALLSGAARAMLRSVEFNLSEGGLGQKELQAEARRLAKDISSLDRS
jgi:formiminotetrahydrofolate cyclodeaminase